MKYVTTIEYDDGNDEYMLPIPEELLTALGWVEGDNLKWEYADDSILLSKTND